jgi:hypothetical protein
MQKQRTRHLKSICSVHLKSLLSCCECCARCTLNLCCGMTVCWVCWTSYGPKSTTKLYTALPLFGSLLLLCGWVRKYTNCFIASCVHQKSVCSDSLFVYWTCTRGRNLSDAFSTIWKQCFLKWSVYRWINRLKNNSTYTWSRKGIVTICFHYGWEHWLNPYHDLE